MKQAVGQKVAGKFQYNRFVALMDNPEYYQKAYNATQGASGMMDQMNDIYIESIEGRLNTLRAAGEQLMSTLFDQDTVEPIIENVTNLVNGLNTVVEVAGGGIPVFTALSALLLKTFSPQIATQINQIATNMATMSQASNNMKNMEEAMIMAGQMGRGLDSKTYDVANRGMASVKGLNQASQEKMASIVQQMGEAEERIVVAESNINELAAQLTTKYQQRLALTEQEAQTLEIELREQIQQGTLTQEQVRSLAQQIGLEEEQVELIRVTRSESNAVAQAFREMNSATEGVDSNLRAADAAIQGFKSEQLARGFTQGLSALMSFAFGVQSLTSLFSILGDETASLEDKVNAVLISGVMGLSMLMNTITSVKSGFDAIATGLLGTEQVAATAAMTEATNVYYAALTELTAAQDAYNIALGTGIPEEIASAEAKLVSARAAKEEALANVESANSKVADTEATLANVIAAGKENLAIKVNTAIKKEGTLVSKLYAAGEKILGVAATEAAGGTVALGAAIARIAIPIAAAAAAIGGLIFLYQK